MGGDGSASQATLPLSFLVKHRLARKQTNDQIISQVAHAATSAKSATCSYHRDQLRNLANSKQFQYHNPSANHQDHPQIYTGHLDTAMEEGSLHKSLPLRLQKDKPVLKYSGSGVMMPVDSVSHQQTCRPAAVPLYNPTDLQNYRHQHGNLHLHGFPASATPQYTMAVAAPIMPPPNYNNQANYAFMMGPGTPSGMGVTPNQILNSDVAGMGNKVKSPYNRPLSAQDVQIPESAVVPPTQWSSAASNSTSSISSVGSNGATNATTIAPPMPSPLSLQHKQPSPESPSSLQTNSFMRPQSTYKMDTSSNEGVTRPQRIGNSNRPLQRRHSDRISRPGHSGGTRSGSIVRPVDRHSVKPSASPLVVTASGRLSNSVASANQMSTRQPLSRQVPLPREMPLDMKPPVSPLTKTSNLTADHGRKATDAQKKVTISPLKTGIIKKPPLPQSPKACTTSSNTSSPKKQAPGLSKTSSCPPQRSSNHFQPLSQSSGPSVGDPSTNTGTYMPSSESDPSVQESRDESPFRPGTPAADAASKVRNLNYTPTKPYKEVADPTVRSAKSTTTGVGSTPRSARRMRVESTEVTKPSPPKLTRPMNSRPTSSNTQSLSNTQLSKSPTKDTGVINPSKKVSVTNSLSGTIYYRKQSKSEEVIHDLKRRPLADGASSRDQSRDRMTGESGSDEWEDEEGDVDSMALGR